MAATKYTYSIQNNFPNHLVATDRLSKEIRDETGIVPELQGINTAGDVCDVWFAAALGTGEQALLNGIVAAHSGTVLPDEPWADEWVSNATGTVAGKVKLTGQLSGTYNSPTVVGIKEAGAGTALLIGTVADGKFLKRVGTGIVGADAGGGGTSGTEIEVDFGTAPKRTGKFTITDAGVGATQKIQAWQSQAAATGRHADENEMDQLSCSTLASTGTFLLIIRPLCGAVHGKYKIVYIVVD